MLLDSGYSSFFIVNVAFLSVKLLQFGIVWLAPRSFDTSTHLLLERYGIYSNPWWSKLLSWDSVFFIKNSTWMKETGSSAPQYEHEWAFSPIWSKIIQSSDLQHTVIKAVALNIALHYVSTWIIYALTKHTFPPFGKQVQTKMALTTSVLFILSSAGGFLISVYSEPIAFTFSLLGMLSRQWSIEFDVYGSLHFGHLKWFFYILSSVCFSFAFLNRTNCLLLGIFYIHDSWNLFSRKKWINGMLYPVLSGAILFSIFIYTYYYLPYTALCPERGEWCNTKIYGLPITHQSLYSYIQAKHWNVGFLKYWTPNNIPNFLFGLPNIVVLWNASTYFSYQYPTQNLKPYVWITRAFLLIMIFLANVQIINRVSSFLPLSLWYISDSLTKNANDMRVIKYYLMWLLVWIPTQTALFACFLPPA